MSNKKVIQLNTSSALELKAEIAKHEDEFRKEKAAFEATGIKPIKKSLKKDVWDKSNVGIEKRIKRDAQIVEPTSLEDYERLELSRKMLEKKAKLYEQLIKEGKEFDLTDDNTLIDFEKKNWELPNEKLSPKKVNDLEEWVEYTDEFGRTRVGKKSEVEKLKQENKREEPELLSKDMERELARQAWEKEVEEENAKEALHFNASKEHRTLGVGFYKFSTTEEERIEQMKNLNKLRKETELKRALHKSIEEKRRLMLEERMKKVLALRDKRLKTVKENEGHIPELTNDLVVDILKRI